MLYRVAEDELLLCVNASNVATDLAWMREVHAASGLDCEIVDESDDTALLALQGPRALDIASRIVEDDDPPPRRSRFRTARAAGVDVWLSRTGYTGEDGYEIYTAATDAPALWDALVDAGGDDLSLAGLGARDTLRTEMAYSLYGHELCRERNPIEAGLERFLAFGTGFIGEAALEAVRERGPAERLVGLVVEGRAVARAGFPILADSEVGSVTSGTFGPSIERSIAIGYVPARCAAPGTRVEVEIRSRRVPCTVTETPFYSRKA
jgi:aminomethyltransferase